MLYLIRYFTQRAEFDFVELLEDAELDHVLANAWME